VGEAGGAQVAQRGKAVGGGAVVVARTGGVAAPAGDVAAKEARVALHPGVVPLARQREGARAQRLGGAVVAEQDGERAVVVEGGAATGGAAERLEGAQPGAVARQGARVVAELGEGGAEVDRVSRGAVGVAGGGGAVVRLAEALGGGARIARARGDHAEERRGARHAGAVARALGARARAVEHAPGQLEIPPVDVREPDRLERPRRAGAGRVARIGRLRGGARRLPAVHQDAPAGAGQLPPEVVAPLRRRDLALEDGEGPLALTEPPREQTLERAPPPREPAPRLGEVPEPPLVLARLEADRRELLADPRVRGRSRSVGERRFERVDRLDQRAAPAGAPCRRDRCAARLRRIAGTPPQPGRPARLRLGAARRRIRRAPRHRPHLGGRRGREHPLRQRASDDRVARAPVARAAQLAPAAPDQVRQRRARRLLGDPAHGRRLGRRRRLLAERQPREHAPGRLVEPRRPRAHRLLDPPAARAGRARSAGHCLGRVDELLDQQRIPGRALPQSVRAIRPRLLAEQRRRQLPRVRLGEPAQRHVEERPRRRELRQRHRRRTVVRDLERHQERKAPLALRRRSRERPRAREPDRLLVARLHARPAHVQDERRARRRTAEERRESRERPERAAAADRVEQRAPRRARRRGIPARVRARPAHPLRVRRRRRDRPAQRLDHLRERPLGVEDAPAEIRRRDQLGALPRLAQEPALAHAGRPAHDRDLGRVHPAARGRRRPRGERLAQRLQLRAAAHQLGARPPAPRSAAGDRPIPRATGRAAPRPLPRRQILSQRALQVLRQGRRARVPPVRLLAQELGDDLRQRRGHGRIQPLERRRRLLEDRVHESRQRVRAERQPAGAQLEQRRAQRVEVGTRATLAVERLRRHVRDRARHGRLGHSAGRRPGRRPQRPRRRLGRARLPGQSEVDQHDLATPRRRDAPGQEHVRGLHVAMEHAVRVQVPERLRQREPDARHALEVRRRVPRLVAERREVGPGHQLLREEERAHLHVVRLGRALRRRHLLHHAEVVHARQRRMRQLREQRELALQQKT
jgi:hypothetical protein